MKKIHALVLATTLLLFACSADDTIVLERGFQLNEPFQLTYQETATCSCNPEFSITFSTLLEDSVCDPVDGEFACIWEGGIKVGTTVQLPETAIVELFRGANLTKDYLGQIDTIDNYIINITNAERARAERDNAEAYTIELVVSAL